MSALGPRGVSGADKVLDLFDALGKDGGITPNTVAYICVIRAWGDKGDWRRAEEVMLLRWRGIDGCELSAPDTCRTLPLSF